MASCNKVLILMLDLKIGGWLMTRLCGFATAYVLGVMLAAAPAFAEDAGVWQGLRADIFGSAAISEEDGTVKLDAPVRAEDASLVPLSITLPVTAAGLVTKLTLIVDENPSPVVATFAFGPASGDGERTLTTRVRFDRYTTVRVVTQTADGKLHMTSKFVKASGGCSAPAGKDADAALEGAGRMQIRTTAGKAPSGINQSLVMIKHPNFTGMQMDQLTREYTPARYIDEMTVTSGDQLVFKMTGGISISENPHFIFTYPGGPKVGLTVTARDSTGAVFSGKSAESGT
jgi:sulfur-oxidizing protein SoxY